MRRIRFRRKRNRRVWGLAFPDEWRIELDPDLDEKTEMEIAIHECVHVIAPDIDEETVDEIGVHAADVLWRLGFRREE